MDSSSDNCAMFSQGRKHRMFHAARCVALLYGVGKTFPSERSGRRLSLRRDCKQIVPRLSRALSFIISDRCVGKETLHRRLVLAAASGQIEAQNVEDPQKGPYLSTWDISDLDRRNDREQLVAIAVCSGTYEPV